VVSARKRASPWPARTPHSIPVKYAFLYSTLVHCVIQLESAMFYYTLPFYTVHPYTVHSHPVYDAQSCMLALAPRSLGSCRFHLTLPSSPGIPLHSLLLSRHSLSLPSLFSRHSLSLPSSSPAFPFTPFLLAFPFTPFLFSRHFLSLPSSGVGARAALRDTPAGPPGLIFLRVPPGGSGELRSATDVSQLPHKHLQTQTLSSEKRVRGSGARLQTAALGLARRPHQRTESGVGCLREGVPTVQ